MADGTGSPTDFGPGLRRTPAGPPSGRSMIPEVPFRRRAQPAAPRPATGDFPRYAAMVYGGLAVIFAVTLLVESHLANLETARLEQGLLQLASLSGQDLDEPETRLERVKAEVARIREDFGVQVHYLYQPERFFARAWREGRFSAKAAQLPLDDVERALPFVRAFLSRYPETVIRDNLDDIYLSSQLSLFGKEYGGTYTWSSIHVSGANADYSYGGDFVLQALHHEFSSILMHNYDFPFDTWRAVNESGFVYPGNALDMLDTGEGGEINGELLKAGFLTRYSQSDIENDINVMAEWLFLRRDELARMGRLFDRIDRKTQIAVAFYNRIDPDLEID